MLWSYLQHSPGAMIPTTTGPMLHHPAMTTDMMFQQFPHAGGDHMPRVPTHFPYMPHWPAAAAGGQQQGEMTPRFMMHPQLMQQYQQQQYQMHQFAHPHAAAAAAVAAQQV